MTAVSVTQTAHMRGYEIAILHVAPGNGARQDRFEQLLRLLVLPVSLQ